MWSALIIAAVTVVLIGVGVEALVVLRKAVRYELAVTVAVERRERMLATLEQAGCGEIVNPHVVILPPEPRPDFEAMRRLIEGG